MERTVVLIKPDGLQRGLVGEIIGRFERKGLKLIGLKMMRLDDPVLDKWYSHHRDKPFFADLKNFMKSSPIVAMLWEGIEAVETVRLICGATNSRKATPGTIRGDLSMSTGKNIIHASDVPSRAKEEADWVFENAEIFEYDKSEYLYVYGEEEL